MASHHASRSRRSAMTTAATVAGLALVAAGCSTTGDTATATSPAPVSPTSIDVPEPSVEPSSEPSDTGLLATLPPEQVEWVAQAQPVVEKYYAAWAGLQQQPSADIQGVKFQLHEVAGQEYALATARQIARLADAGDRVNGGPKPFNVTPIDVGTIVGPSGEGDSQPTVVFDLCVDVRDVTVITADGQELPPYGDTPDMPLPGLFPARAWVQDVGEAELPGLPEGWVATGGVSEQAEQWVEPEVDPCDIG